MKQDKFFFGLLLLISIAFPFYSFFTMIGDFAHNQYKMRPKMLADTSPKTMSSAHLGLTGAQLAEVDELVRSAYQDSVHDGYRLGVGYDRLWQQSLGLDAILFVASLIGLRLCYNSDRLTSALQRL